MTCRLSQYCGSAGLGVAGTCIVCSDTTHNRLSVRVTLPRCKYRVTGNPAFNTRRYNFVIIFCYDYVVKVACVYVNVCRYSNYGRRCYDVVLCLTVVNYVCKYIYDNALGMFIVLVFYMDFVKIK